MGFFAPRAPRAPSLNYKYGVQARNIPVCVLFCYIYEKDTVVEFDIFAFIYYERDVMMQM